MDKQNIIRRFISALLLLVFVNQWLKPLTQLSSWTDLYTVEPLFLTMACILAVDVLKIPFAAGLTLKTFIALSSIAAMFH